MSARRSPNAASGQVGYIPILDGWRAVAILLVLLFHSLLNSNTAGHPTLNALAALSGRLGALGVLVFFCISGYLITLKLFSESGGGKFFSVRNFYIKRVFRIVPPLACYLLVIGILYLFGLLKLESGDWYAPIFLTNYVDHSWYTAHFWSLSVEEHFYFFWPICIIVAGWRRAMWVGIFVIVAVGLWRPWELNRLTDQAHQAGALQHTDMRLDYIMMGCVVALAINFYPRARQILTLLGSAYGMLALAAGLVVTTLHLPFDPRSLQAAILTLMVCGSASANLPFFNKVLANPAMLFIGRISYSLYIWQELLLAPSTNPHISTPFALLIRFPLVLLVSCLSYYLVEKKFIRYGRRFLTRDVPAS